MAQVEAILLAAGASRRFGSENKLLKRHGGSSIVGSVAQALVDCGLPVILVTGFDAERVSAECPSATVVHNPDWELGMGGSMAVGASAVKPGNAILVALGDMPGLRSEVVIAMIEALEDRAERIVAPVYADQPDRHGHPVLFGPAFRDSLTLLSGDRGARPIIEGARDLVRVPFAGGFADIDTLADLSTPQY